MADFNARNRHPFRFVFRNDNHVTEAAVSFHDLPNQRRRFDEFHLIMRHEIEPETQILHLLKRRKGKVPPRFDNRDLSDNPIALVLKRANL